MSQFIMTMIAVLENDLSSKTSSLCILILPNSLLKMLQYPQGCHQCLRGVVSITIFFCQFASLYLALIHHLDSSFFFFEGVISSRRSCINLFRKTQYIRHFSCSSMALFNQAKPQYHFSVYIEHYPCLFCCVTFMLGIIP